MFILSNYADNNIDDHLVHLFNQDMNIKYDNLFI